MRYYFALACLVECLRVSVELFQGAIIVAGLLSGASGALLEFALLRGYTSLLERSRLKIVDWTERRKERLARALACYVRHRITRLQ